LKGWKVEKLIRNTKGNEAQLNKGKERGTIGKAEREPQNIEQGMSSVEVIR
jgi:hypothetical protein